MHYYYVTATALRLAVDSIRVHKLRSFLTLLGIIIGVASVVVVGAAIEGLGLFAETSTAQAFGTDSYLIAQVASVGQLDRRERAAKLRRNKRIRREDLEYLRQVTGEAVVYSPYRQRPDDVKRGGETYEGAMVLGVAHSLAEIRDLGLAEGRFFTETEERTGQRVAVIGNELREKLFVGSSPLGGTVRLRGLDFRVIGYQEKLGSMGPRSQDNSLYIPDSVFERLYGKDKSMAIFGGARPGTGLTMAAALDLSRAALRSRFKTPPGEEDNFDFLTPDAIRGFVDSILGVIRAVVVPVTLISLVVGGIVIMNIMLVSVTERTREIGIRKAIGARRGDIMLQFLIEAVLLALLGGAIGLTLGAALSEGLAVAFDLSLRVTLPYVALALIVSSAVGIISGWYPAARASKLDPVEALRNE
ncbi:MAG: ABC transporter permease [bacterium]|nr:ABC transporter permease [bacterium]